MLADRYNPALDGIRALAVSLVLGFHAFVPRFSGGYLGVDVFFVLSGYLITSLLTEEIDRGGTIDIRRFYVRRLVRLTPALLFMLSAYVLLSPLLWPEVSLTIHVRDAAIALFYLSDYTSAIWSIPLRLRHTWSLAVEEHFYLLWPPVLLYASRRFSAKQLVPLLLAAYVAATSWRVICDLSNGQGYDATYFRFDTRLSGLIAGALLAAARLPKTTWTRVNPDLVALVALLVIGLCTWRFTVGSTVAITIGMTCIEWATLAGLWVVTTNRDTWTFKLLSMRVPVFIGRMSYGIYLWHYPIFRMLWDREPWYLTIVIGSVLALLMAYISHRTVERVSRRLFGIHSAPAADIRVTPR